MKTGPVTAPTWHAPPQRGKGEFGQVGEIYRQIPLMATQKITINLPNDIF
jgi:hypothetical protein